MKTILLIFIFALSLKADYLFQFRSGTVSYGYCLNSYSFINNTSINIVKSEDNSNVIFPISYYTNISFLDGYEYINGSCTPKTTNYNNLGLTEEQFNISMAFYGIFLSSLIAFGLIKAF